MERQDDKAMWSESDIYNGYKNGREHEIAGGFN